MKKSQSFFALLIFCLSFVLIPATDIAAMWDVPVAPGESFRWVFVTSQKTVGTSSEIDFYNDFINNFVMGSLSDIPISGVAGKAVLGEIQWKAIASTAEVDAFDNIGGPSEVGVYNPLGTLIEVSTNAMFDGDLLYPININEYGSQYLGDVWTGSKYDGTGDQGFTMGSERISIGLTLNSFWLNYPGLPSLGVFVKPQYAISEVLTVVPVPGSFMLAATGLLSYTLGLNRLRRRHQE